MYPSHRSKLLFTDTDSLTYLIQMENSYQDMYLEKHFFDFSEYHCASIYFNGENGNTCGA